MTVVSARRRRRPVWRMLLLATLLAAGGGILPAWIRARGGERYDYIIHNATIVDGTGGPPFAGGIGVTDDRIVAIWRGTPFLRPHALVQEIDARGLVLAPGFIDTHTHVDLGLSGGDSPIRAANFAGQGVTTVIAGNCGRSPLSPDLLRRLVASRRANINIAELAGLNSIRQQVLGDSPAAPTGEQLGRLCILVDRWMAEGAVGVSTGYAYIPGRFATPAEITAQLRVAARYGGVHATHIRDEGSAILPALDEALGASRAAHIPVLVSHLKITGRASCRLYEQMLGKFAAYRSRAGAAGLFFDQYPYDASSTDLELYLPTWFLALPESQRYQFLAHNREALRREVRERLAREKFEDFGFASVSHYGRRGEFRGLTIPAIDRQYYGHRRSSIDSQLDIVFEMLMHGGAQMIYHNICPDLLERIPRDLAVMVGSDSAIRYDDGKSLPHPRGWGTFPAVLKRYVREKKLLRLETAVARMTDMPARFFGFEDRGRIERGYFADLVLFNPDDIADRATYESPFLPPTGIRWVFVNGQPVVAEKAVGWNQSSVEIELTSKMPGRFLCRSPRFRRQPDGLITSTRTNEARRLNHQQPLLVRLFSPL